jgi:hypothetical protein
MSKKKAMFFKQAGGGLNPLAETYINAVNTHITLSTTEEDAINTLVNTLDTDGNLNGLFGMYLPIWANADANAINLEGTSVYDITWGGSLTHGSNGVVSDGSTGYGNTNLNHQTIGVTDFSFGFYSGTSTLINGGFELGVNSFGQYTRLDIVSGSNHLFGVQGLALTTPLIDSTGMHIGTRTSATDMRYSKNGTILATDNTSANPTPPDLDIYLLAHNQNNGADAFSNLECRTAFISNGMTDTQISNMNTAIQTFLTTLGKNI